MLDLVDRSSSVRDSVEPKTDKGSIYRKSRTSTKLVSYFLGWTEVQNDYRIAPEILRRVGPSKASSHISIVTDFVRASASSYHWCCF